MQNGFQGLPLNHRIRLARVQAGFSQEKLAVALGTSRRHVIKWEKGHHRPSALYVARLVEVTGQPRELFQEGDDDDEESDPVVQLMAAVERFARTMGPKATV